MGNWRSIRALARAQVHRTFEQAAVYLTHAAGTPVACSVRVHARVLPLDMGHDFDDASQYVDIAPKVLFPPQGPRPLRNALVFVSRAEIYRLGAPETPDRDGYTRVEASRLDASEATATVAALDAATLAALDSVA